MGNNCELDIKMIQYYYRAKFVGSNNRDGDVTYVFELLNFDTDEKFKLELAPKDEYRAENYQRVFCNNVPLFLDEKKVYLVFAIANRNILPLIPQEYLSYVLQGLKLYDLENEINIDEMIDEVVGQDEVISDLTSKEEMLRRELRSIEAQKDLITNGDYISDKSKALGGK